MYSEYIQNKYMYVHYHSFWIICRRHFIVFGDSMYKYMHINKICYLH